MTPPFRMPYIYGINFQMPAPWRSRRADRRSLAVDKDFYLEELSGIYRYDFRVRIGVNGEWLSKVYLPAEFAVPRGGRNGHPLTSAGARVIFCPAGGVLEVDAFPPKEFRWRSNPIYIRFVGQVSA